MSHRESTALYENRLVHNTIRQRFFDVIHTAPLNPRQKEAYLAAASSPKDLLVIIGPTGTGKSKTLAWLILVIISIGIRILVTTLLNKANDELLLKLIEA